MFCLVPQDHAQPRATYDMSEATVVSYTDADHASQLHWHSIPGYTFCIRGGAVSWSSKKQPIVALLTTEASMSWLCMPPRSQVALCTHTELTGPQASPPPSIVNNQSVIALSKDRQHHTWTKHIDVCFHFANEPSTTALYYYLIAPLST